MKHCLSSGKCEQLHWDGTSRTHQDSEPWDRPHQGLACIRRNRWISCMLLVEGKAVPTSGKRVWQSLVSNTHLPCNPAISPWVLKGSEAFVNPKIGTQMLLEAVLVSCSCCNRAQTWWLRTVQVYPLIILSKTGMLSSSGLRPRPREWQLRCYRGVHRPDPLSGLSGPRGPPALPRHRTPIQSLLCPRRSFSSASRTVPALLTRTTVLTTAQVPISKKRVNKMHVHTI